MDYRKNASDALNLNGLRGLTSLTGNRHSDILPRTAANEGITHIDIAKGITIILVALLHSHLTAFYPKSIHALGLFRLPLFFMLAGVLYEDSIHSAYSLFLNKFDRLMKPYLFTLCVSVAISALLGESAIAWQLKGIIYATCRTIDYHWGPIWFLPHLFAIFLYVHLVYKITKIQSSSIVYKLLFLVAQFVVGLAVAHYFYGRQVWTHGLEILGLGLPFSSDILLMTSTFFMFGNLFRNRTKDFHPNRLFVVLCSVAFIIIAILTEAKIDFNRRIYSDPIFATMAACCGICVVISLSMYMQNFGALSKIFYSFGKASLFILIFHSIIERASYNYLHSLSLVEPHFLATLAFLIGITLPLAIKQIIQHIPWLAACFFPIYRLHRRSIGHRTTMKWRK